ncbi:MAG TPA: exodeoxyribonuclease VII small subunit [Saprospiraceae bacterium]|nr:exodeoxyribonuclease VII small subunit [Saprospiraceae bacterium]
MSKSFSYDKAMQELQSIIEQLQNEETGLDQLSDLIRKANRLINECRKKLRQIDEEINQLKEDSSQQD